MSVGKKVFFVVLMVSFLVSPAFGAEKRMTVKDVSLFYTDDGTGGTPLVFVHGWACNHDFWRDQVPAFSAQRRVLALDLPGHGESDAPERQYTMDYFAGCVAEWIKKTGAGKSVLVGHSMGFPIIWQVAKKYPELVSALVSVDGVYFQMPESQEQIQQMELEFANMAMALTSEDAKENMTSFLNGMFVDNTPIPLRNEILTKMLATKKYVARSAMANLVEPAVWDQQKVSAPLLAIYVKTPDLPLDAKQYLSGLFPKGVTYREIENQGHFVMMEIPARINRLIFAFLEDNGL